MLEADGEDAEPVVVVVIVDGDDESEVDERDDAEEVEILVRGSAAAADNEDEDEEDGTEEEEAMAGPKFGERSDAEEEERMYADDTGVVPIGTIEGEPPMAPTPPETAPATLAADNPTLIDDKEPFRL